jgi:hydrogenase maturation protease
MSRDDVAAVARTLLYEGYLLYPYRPSSVKNRQRFNFGVIYPERYGRGQDDVDPWLMQTECLVLGGAGPVVDVEVGFLQLVTRTILLAPEAGATGPVEVDRLVVGDRVYQTWQEAVERRVRIERLELAELEGRVTARLFAFPATDEREPIPTPGGGTAGFIRRRQAAIAGEIQVEVRAAAANGAVLAVRIMNRTDARPDPARREDVLAHCLVSAHTIITVEQGEFVSLLDPPDELRQVAAECRNLNTWPVLAGTAPARDTMLSSPIILYDYPEIAPESAGDLFDGTEIDEILSLRIMTLSDAERREIAQTDERARLLLERTESLAAEQLMSLHGVMRLGGRGRRG